MDLIIKVSFKTLDHLVLVFTAIFIALLIGLPLGISLARSKSKWLRETILRLIGIIQTIPGLAFIALLIVFFAAIRPVLHLPITGTFPSVVLLVLYALLPIVINTYTGLTNVPSSTIEVAKAMGMRPGQRLMWVEIPLSLEAILTGIRLSLIYTIGMATLTSLIGSGGLGDLILQGLRTMQIDLVLAGTIPATFFALFFDFFISKIGLWLLPSSRRSTSY